MAHRSYGAAPKLKTPHRSFGASPKLMWHAEASMCHRSLKRAAEASVARLYSSSGRNKKTSEYSRLKSADTRSEAKLVKAMTFPVALT
jgi:hypothetical protein